MAKYATRTCVSCGIRKPQPQMVHKEILVNTGNSRRGTTGSTWLGALAGNKKANRAIEQSLFNTQHRNYWRKRKVWMCPDCAKQYKAPKKSNNEGWGWWVIVIVFFILFALGSGG